MVQSYRIEYVSRLMQHNLCCISYDLYIVRRYGVAWYNTNGIFAALLNLKIKGFDLFNSICLSKRAFVIAITL